MPPWAVSVPSAPDLAALLNLPADTCVAAFHLVERGHIELKLQDGTGAIIQAGEMAVCFAGAAHQLSQGQNPQVLSCDCSFFFTASSRAATWPDIGWWQWKHSRRGWLCSH